MCVIFINGNFSAGVYITGGKHDLEKTTVYTEISRDIKLL